MVAKKASRWMAWCTLYRSWYGKLGDVGGMAARFTRARAALSSPDARPMARTHELPGNVPGMGLNSAAHAPVLSFTYVVVVGLVSAGKASGKANGSASACSRSWPSTACSYATLASSLPLLYTRSTPTNTPSRFFT